MVIKLLREGFLQPTSLEMAIAYEARFDRKFSVRDVLLLIPYFHLSVAPVTDIQAIKTSKRNELGGGAMAFTARDLDVLRDDTARNLRLEDEDLRDTGRALIKSERPGYKKGKMRGDDRYEWSVRPNVALRLNNDRFGVVIRDEVIVKAASDRWNDAAAEVVRALLKAVFNEKSRLNNHASTQATADEIEKNIPKGKVGLLQAGVSGFKSKVLADLIPIYLNTMSNVDNLDRESNPFLSLDPSGRAAFQVEFEAIAVKARANLLLDLVRGTLGGRGARVLAAVAKAHHITEQQVSKG
jgi:DNA-directed RNA polymerase III subunit RPC3